MLFSVLLEHELSSDMVYHPMLIIMLLEHLTPHANITLYYINITAVNGNINYLFFFSDFLESLSKLAPHMSKSLTCVCVCLRSA